MSALTDDELKPVPTGQWLLPLDADEFLGWLRGTSLPGATDADRLDFFLTIPAGTLMPKVLRDELEARGLVG